MDMNECHKKHAQIVDNFLDLLLEASFVAVRDIMDHIYFKNIFLSGASTASVIQKKVLEFYSSKQ
jgi:hypothetical protein